MLFIYIHIIDFDTGTMYNLYCRTFTVRHFILNIYKKLKIFVIYQINL